MRSCIGELCDCRSYDFSIIKKRGEIIEIKNTKKDKEKNIGKHLYSIKDIKNKKTKEEKRKNNKENS